MTESFDRIAGWVKDLIERNKELAARVQTLEEASQRTALRPSFAPGNPVAMQQYGVQVIVSSVLPDSNLFYVKRLRTDASSFWTIDTSLSPLLARVGSAETLPSSGDMGSVSYLGEYVDSDNQGQPVYRSVQFPTHPTQFVLKTIVGDTVTAATLINSVEGATYNIAKPWKLRRTPFDTLTIDGITYTYTSDVARSATDGTDTESQVVVPEYRVGDIFYAQPVRGIELAVDGDEVVWLDMNVDARAWAKDDS